MSARKPEIVAEFVDRYGDTRVVHRGRSGKLALKNNDTTVALTMNRAAAVEIGKRIKHYREAAGMSLAELCIRAGLVANAQPKARMWEIENAIRGQGMRIGTLYAISRALAVPIDRFFPTTEEIVALTGVRLVVSTPRLAVIQEAAE